MQHTHVDIFSRRSDNEPMNELGPQTGTRASVRCCVELLTVPPCDVSSWAVCASRRPPVCIATYSAPRRDNSGVSQSLPVAAHIKAATRAQRTHTWWPVTLNIAADRLVECMPGKASRSISSTCVSLLSPASDAPAILAPMMRTSNPPRWGLSGDSK